MGDLNCEDSEKYLDDLYKPYNLPNVVEKPTCFKNLNNPPCVDLFLIKWARSFQNTNTFEIGLSDFHNMIVSVMKAHYEKWK